MYTPSFSVWAIVLMLLPISAWAQSRMTNIVCFVRFADESEDVFQHSPAFYEQLFNAEGEGVNSVYNYFLWSSYGKLQWKSHCFPQTGTETTRVLSYQDKLKRCERQPYNATTNPEGYSSYYKATLLEHELVERVAAWLDTVVPDTLKLDHLTEGTLDDLTIIYSGNSEKSSSKGILWPHQDASLLFSTAKVNGCRVRRYLAVFDNANGYKTLLPQEINTGVLCHEMMHVLGAYDLYTSSGDNSAPVGTWDLMSNNLNVPQGFTAYSRWHWGGWMDQIPELTDDGVYTLYPVGGNSPEKVAYRIVPSKASSEYFMLEYRKKEGTFESGIPASGLICYRISRQYQGNLSPAGHELYIFRQNATANYAKAVLTSDIGLTEGNTDNSPIKYTYSDGKRAPFSITEVGTCGDSITFRISGLPTNGITLKESASDIMVYHATQARLEVAGVPSALIICYDMNGRIVSQGQDVSHLSPGIYTAVAPLPSGRKAFLKFKR